jgi:hypothetical protein
MQHFRRPREAAFAQDNAQDPQIAQPDFLAIPIRHDLHSNFGMAAISATR